MILLGVIPGFYQSISDSIRACLIGSEVVEVEPGPGEGVLNVVHNGPLQRLLVISQVGAHQLPHLLSALLVLVIFEFKLK